MRIPTRSIRLASRSRSAAAIMASISAVLLLASACGRTPHAGGAHSGTTAPSGSGSPSGHPAGPSGPQASPSTSGIALGIFVHYSSNGSNFSSISSFLSQLGRTPAIIQGFYGWKTSTGAAVPFPLSFVNYVSSLGAVPMITWQPGQASANNQLNGQTGGGATNRARLDQPDFSLNALAGGSQDSYIQQWAQAAKAYGKTVYVRLMHEMNDHSYPWALGVNGNSSPAQYVAAWRHIVGIFQQVGATNVQFVWCAGARPANSPFQALYPGNAYVQWVSLDGYNRLKNQPGFESFSQIFSGPYQEITSFSDRPVMIAETASVEDPGNPQAKASWITSAFLQQIPQQFPRIKAVLYFDSTGRGFDYPLNSSPQAFAAFKAVAENPLYQAAAPTSVLTY